MDERSTPTPAETRPTWRDVLPPGYPDPPLTTREELLARFREGELPVTERTLRYWEAQGVLPRPVRQWHHDAVRTVYPTWWDTVVEVVAARTRAQGESLQAVAADTPRIINLIGALSWAVEHRIVLLADPDRTIGQLIERTEQHTGRAIGEVVITFLDATTRDTVSSAVYKPPADRDTVSSASEAAPTDSTKPNHDAKNEDRGV